MAVKVTDCRGSSFRILVFGKSEAFGAAGFAVVDEAEGDYAADRLEDLGDLFFGETWSKTGGCVSRDVSGCNDVVALFVR